MPRVIRAQLFRAGEFFPLAALEARQLRAQRSVVRGFLLVRPRVPPIRAAERILRHTLPGAGPTGDGGSLLMIDGVDELG